MKIKQTAEVRFSSAWASYGGLEITDVDGTEVTIKMTNDQWLALEQRVVNKCESIRRERQEEIDEIIEQRVAAQLEKEKVSA